MFTDTFLPNKDGVVTSILNQIKGLTKHGVEVVVFAPSDEAKLEYIGKTKIYYIKGLNFKKYPGYKIVLPTQFISRLQAFLEVEKPDIYHIHSPFSLGIAGMMFASKFKKPIVGTFHTSFEDYIGYLFNNRVNKTTKYIFGMTGWKYFKLFFNMCNYTISPTKEIAKLLRKKGFKKVVTIPSTIDFESLKKQKKVNIRKKWNISKSTKIILYVGRLGFEKKLIVLLDAFKSLKGNNVLLIVGKGPYEEKYKKYIKENKINNVVFTGYVSNKELPSYYKSCNIFVNPSDTETQGLTLIEAMSFGKPVIGANKLGPKEIIKNRKNGLKFNPGNSKDLKNKINLLLTNKNLYKKISNKCKKDSKKFSIEPNIKSLIRIYKKIKYKKKIDFTKITKPISKTFKNILNFD